jgi:hypothetical protein
MTTIRCSVEFCESPASHLCVKDVCDNHRLACSCGVVVGVCDVDDCIKKAMFGCCGHRYCGSHKGSLIAHKWEKHQGISNVLLPLSMLKTCNYVGCAPTDYRLFGYHTRRYGSLCASHISSQHCEVCYDYYPVQTKDYLFCGTHYCCPRCAKRVHLAVWILKFFKVHKDVIPMIIKYILG